MRISARSLAVSLIVIALTSVATVPVRAANKEAEVRSTIEAFYKAFDEGFTKPANFAGDDWNHINPFGGRTRGREAVLKEVREVHQSFLKGATSTPESMDIRFATPEVAVGTVVSVGKAAGGKPGRAISTFVVVRRGKRWQIMQDHSTLIQEPH